MIATVSRSKHALSASKEKNKRSKKHSRKEQRKESKYKGYNGGSNNIEDELIRAGLDGHMNRLNTEPSDGNNDNNSSTSASQSVLMKRLNREGYDASEDDKQYKRVKINNGMSNTIQEVS